MAVSITPLEDLFRRGSPTLTSYQKLVRELKRYLPTPDARHLAWHLEIPQFVFHHTLNRTPSLMPQYDTLGCAHCKTTFRIPMKYPRYHEKTLNAYRAVYYTPSPPQECPCGNLKTLTDIRGNLRVYLLDPTEESFTLYNGFINLRGSEEHARSDPYDVPTLLDQPRPPATNPFSYELRSQLLLNHINLYRVSPVIAKTLLPTEDPLEYSRVFNVVIFYGDYILFPTGHKINTDYFPGFQEKSKHLEGFSPAQLLNKAILTQESARLLNKFAEYLYTQRLPEVIHRVHEQNISSLATSLRLSIPEQTDKPLFLPFARRLNYNVEVPERKLRTPDTLTKYSDLSILRLSQFSKKSRTSNYAKQDFINTSIRLGAYQEKPAGFTSLRKPILLKLKADRLLLVRYVLPRLTTSPSAIFQYAQHKLNNIELPPKNRHIPINKLLVHATTPSPPRSEISSTL